MHRFRWERCNPTVISARVSAYRFALLGHPVSHSLSPAIHAVAYRELRADASYRLLDCPTEADLEAAVVSIRSGELHGANVTVPWKRDALKLADIVDPSAAQVGAANVLVARGGGPRFRVEAFNTDALALVEELETAGELRGIACVIGAGGAALAACWALQRLGFSDIRVLGRSFKDPRRCAVFQRLGAQPMLWSSAVMGDWSDVAAAADVVVQATSAGMEGADPGEVVCDVVPWERLAPETVAMDVVYRPEVTPFLAAAKRHGLKAVGGLGMLIGQAALSIELWLGQRPSAEGLRRDLEERLR